MEVSDRGFVSSLDIKKRGVFPLGLWLKYEGP